MPQPKAGSHVFSPAPATAVQAFPTQARCETVTGAPELREEGSEPRSEEAPDRSEPERDETALPERADETPDAADPERPEPADGAEAEDLLPMPAPQQAAKPGLSLARHSTLLPSLAA